MRKINRSPTPSVLATNNATWLAELRKARRDKDQKRFETIQGRYGKPAVRTALNKMFDGKCAYCESFVGAVATPHIEHFRPKNIYVSLTFEWTNLHLSCPICNNPAHKGKIFHKTKSGDPLIDPTTEDPAVHLDFIFDLQSKLALVKPKTDRGQLAIDVFGLNKRTDLLKERSCYIWSMLVHKVCSPYNPDAHAEVVRALLPSSKYFAFADRLLR